MNILKYRYFYFAISLVFLIPGIYSLIRFGLRPSIDFVGGSLIEVRLPDGQTLGFDQVVKLVDDNFGLNAVQQSGPAQYMIKAKEIDEAQKNDLTSQLQSEYGEVEVLRFESVGPSISQELLSKTLVAIGLVSVIITIYVWRQFKELKFGVTAVMAMFHDSLILLGSFSLLGYFYGVEVDILFVTAMLTTLSFSVHDTIVVYDRIRELGRKYPRMEFEELANTAVLETLSRSINNSVTIIVMLLALVLLGGATIRWFSTALLIGAITGTYSSSFTAVPLLVEWTKRVKKN
ncbi:protein translocase subunit SecF [Patescibacteria group bacterium]|nr:protein translocase subunit SecF [Patescibacteria group bacterium]